jgi:hypothetical protein
VEIKDLDNRLSNIENGENLVKCNEPEPVDMQEVNELMNEMSEFYDESEETSDLIEERLAKTINTSLRANISESKFKETKSKFKRPQNCQNLLIPTVNEIVWTKGIPNSLSYVLEILDY